MLANWTDSKTFASLDAPGLARQAVCPEHCGVGRYLLHRSYHEQGILASVAYAADDGRSKIMLLNV